MEKENKSDKKVEEELKLILNLFKAFSMTSSFLILGLLRIAVSGKGFLFPVSLFILIFSFALLGIGLISALFLRNKKVDNPKKVLKCIRRLYTVSVVLFIGFILESLVSIFLSMWGWS